MPDPYNLSQINLGWDQAKSLRINEKGRNQVKVRQPQIACLNKIREHEHPVHFLFRINIRLQIFSQATEIQLGAPQKQSVSQLFFIADGHFSIQIIKIHPGFSQQENNVKKVAAHRPAAAKNTQNFLGGQDVGGHDVNS